MLTKLNHHLFAEIVGEWLNLSLSALSAIDIAYCNHLERKRLLGYYEFLRILSFNLAEQKYAKEIIIWASNRRVTLLSAIIHVPTMLKELSEVVVSDILVEKLYILTEEDYADFLLSTPDITLNSPKAMYTSQYTSVNDTLKEEEAVCFFEKCIVLKEIVINAPIPHLALAHTTSMQLQAFHFNKQRVQQKLLASEFEKIVLRHQYSLDSVRLMNFSITQSHLQALSPITSLLHELHVDCSELSCFSIMNFFAKCDMLRVLTLIDSQGVLNNHVIRSLLLHCSLLQHIAITTAKVNCLACILQNTSSLAHITLNDCTILRKYRKVILKSLDNDYVQHLALELRSCNTCINALDIHSAEGELYALYPLIEIFGSMLEHLDLDLTSGRSSVTRPLSYLLSHCLKLKSLTLRTLSSSISLSSQDMKSIAMHCPKLTLLRLQGFAYLRIDAVLEVLRECAELNQLDLHNCSAVDTLLGLVEYGLEYLDVSGTSVTAEQVYAMITSCVSLSTIVIDRDVYHRLMEYAVVKGDCSWESDVHIISY